MKLTAVASAAFAVTAETPPKASAATATTAIFFKIVFVDISFLSLVELGTIPNSA
ncbi:unannotated protein [freshwater metagenome]|uniref:Unannotated protein n=1 Tax=freshwater metagenome TaxID=449393 RepID=A0A6J6C0V8_9ZZZZ